MTRSTARSDLVARIKDNFPQELQALDQWVLWRMETRNDKPTKVPYSVTGQRAESDNPSTWASFAAVCAKFQSGNYAGLGFMFHESDPYAGIDFDKCFDGTVIEQEKRNHILGLASYAELSQSRTGVHVIVRAKLPAGGRKSREHLIEMYDHKRFFCVTGDHIQSTPVRINDRQPQLDLLYALIFPPKATNTHSNANATPSGDIPTDDQELLQIMFESKPGAKIRNLWNGNRGGYSDDDSAADLALCNYLAFFTGRDAERMDRMFRQSGLYRDKWLRGARTGETYGAGTIARAIAATHETYRPRRQVADEAIEITVVESVVPTMQKNSNGNHPGDNADEIEPPEAEREHLTDLGNGKRVARLHGDSIRYTQAWGWSAWDGTRWKRDETGEIMRLAKKTALSFYGESARVMARAQKEINAAEKATQDENPEATDKHAQKAKTLTRLANTLADWAVKCQARARLESMIALAQSERPVAAHSDDFDNHPWLFNVSNGTLDLKEGKLQPHKRTDMLTKCAPVAYDDAAACPTWLAFLSRIMAGDQDVITFLQRAIGYSLTGSTVDHALFFAYGTGQNGKSTFFETIAELFGDYWQKAPTEMLMVKDRTSGIPNDVARLISLRFVVCAEVEEGQRLAEKQVKDLTGGDTLVARFLNKEFFEFKPTHKVWMYGNHKPVIRGTDTGIWRRVMVIPFTVTIPEAERDPNLKDKLKQELPGILNWALQGCLNWQKTGLSAPEVVKLATESYRVESDTFGAFLAERTIALPSARVQAGKLYTAYQNWCSDNGEKPMSGKRFGPLLVERGFRKYQSYGKFVYEGIGLTTDEDDETTNHWSQE